MLTGLQQLIMSTVSNRFSIIQYKDLVSKENRTDPLCDDQRRCMLKSGFQGFSKLSVCPVIQCARAIIQKQDLRIRSQRAGDQKPLSLPSGQIHATFGKNRLVSFFQFIDKTCLCYRYSFYSCFVSYCSLKINIIFNRVAK